MDANTGAADSESSPPDRSPVVHGRHNFALGTLSGAVGTTSAGDFGMTTLFAVIVAGGLLYLFWAVRLRPETAAASARRRTGDGPPATMGDGSA